jgi:ribosomal protein S18 acetylase RimI-like enzyme
VTLLFYSRKSLDFSDESLYLYLTSSPTEESTLAGVWNSFSQVLVDSFSDYTNHYDFNQTLNGPSTSEAYLSWAMSRVGSDALTGLLTFQHAPIGVVSAVQQCDVVEVELAGIAPNAQGHGHYRHLIGQLWRRVDRPNSSRLVISTQVENRKVQAAWKKFGLKPQFELHTTHVMRKK